MDVARLRLIIQKRNGIGNFADVELGEILLHGWKRYEALQILIAVIAMPDALQRANHLKTNSIEQNKTTHKRTPRKQNTTGFVTKHDHGPSLSNVELVEPASVLHGHVANLAVFGGDTQELSATLIEIADSANIIPLNHGHSGPYVGTMQHVLVISVGKVIRPQARETSIQGGRAASPDEHHVLAQFIKLLAVARPETLSQPHQ